MKRAKPIWMKNKITCSGAGLFYRARLMPRTQIVKMEKKRGGDREKLEMSLCDNRFFISVWVWTSLWSQSKQWLQRYTCLDMSDWGVPWSATHFGFTVNSFILPTVKPDTICQALNNTSSSARGSFDSGTGCHLCSLYIVTFSLWG